MNRFDRLQLAWLIVVCLFFFSLVYFFPPGVVCVCVCVRACMRARAIWIDGSDGDRQEIERHYRPGAPLSLRRGRHFTFSNVLMKQLVDVSVQ